MSHSKVSNDSNTTRIAVLETTVTHIHETMERIEKTINTGFSDMSQRFIHLESKVDSNFKWLLTLYIGGGLGLLTVIAKGFHWL